MKKKLIFLVATVLLVSACNNDSTTEYTGPTKVSIDMPGTIAEDGKQTTALGQDDYAGTSQDTRNPSNTTNTQEYQDPVTAQTIANDDGSISYLQTTPGTTVWETTVPPISSTKEWETTAEPYVPEDRIDTTEHLTPTLNNYAELSTSDIVEYFTRKEVFGRRNYEEEFYSDTKELGLLSNKTYKDLIEEYTKKYGDYLLTLHYDTHYETYWIVPNEDLVLSVLQEDDRVFETISTFNTDNTEISYEKSTAFTPEEGKYSRSDNVPGKLLAYCEGLYHNDRYHYIFKDLSTNTYYVWVKYKNDLYIIERNN